MTDSRVRSLGNIIADSLELSNGYADRLLKDVPAATFARLARFVRQDSEVVIESNHPAFIYGHLSLYAPRVLEQIGSSTQPIPASFQTVFSKDAICVDDPTATIYPPMDLVTSYFKSQHQNLVTALRQAPDAIFDAHFLLLRPHDDASGTGECLATHAGPRLGVRIHDSATVHL